jgi:hypothetical protein
MKQRLMLSLAGVTLAGALVSGCAVADDGYFMYRHGNIEAADSFAARAIDRMRAAQEINHYDMQGHAARAIDLMQQARIEMNMAAESATR